MVDAARKTLIRCSRTPSKTIKAILVGKSMVTTCYQGKCSADR